MPTTAVTRPARCVPRRRQRSPEYASGLMSCAAQAIADSNNPPRKKLRIKFPIEKDHQDVAGTDEITNFSREIVYYGSRGGAAASPVIRRAPRLKVTN